MFHCLGGAAFEALQSDVGETQHAPVSEHRLFTHFGPEQSSNAYHSAQVSVLYYLQLGVVHGCCKC